MFLKDFLTKLSVGDSWIDFREVLKKVSYYRLMQLVRYSMKNSIKIDIFIVLLMS